MARYEVAMYKGVVRPGSLSREVLSYQPLKFAMTRETDSLFSSDSWMYTLTQSLLHLPLAFKTRVRGYTLAKEGVSFCGLLWEKTGPRRWECPGKRRECPVVLSRLGL